MESPFKAEEPVSKANTVFEGSIPEINSPPTFTEFNAVLHK